MSNISRRSFLKDAGVAALAVATAGVLAGCSDQETPDTGAKREVKLRYLSRKAGKVFGDVVIKVPALATTVSYATILANKPAAAEGYDIVDPDKGKDKDIDPQGVVTINMDKTKAPQMLVYIDYKLADNSDVRDVAATEVGAVPFVYVDVGTAKIDTSDLLANSENYEVTEWLGTAKVENGLVENGHATVYIKSKN